MAKVLVDTDKGQTLFTKSTIATGAALARTFEDRFSNDLWMEDFSSGFGTANDASKVQVALNGIAALGGGRLKVKRGVYLIGTTVTIPSNVHLQGQGIGVTTFRATSSLGLTAQMFVGATGDTGFGVRVDQNITLEGITFDGIGRDYPAWDAGTNPATYGGLTAGQYRGNLIRFYSATNIKMLYCEIMNHESLVVSLAGCKKVLIHGCLFHNNGKIDDVAPALYVPNGSFPNGTPTEDVLVTNNQFYDNLRSAILFNPDGGGTIANNRFVDNGESTVFSDAGNAIIIDSNYFLRSTITDIVSSGVEINESTNSRVTNNTFDTMDGSGVSCNGMTDGIISDNLIINCGQGAVYPGGPFNFAAGRAPGDPVSSDRRSGISLETGNVFRVLRVKVANNTIIDNQGSPTMQYGISVARTGTPTFTAQELFISDNQVLGGALGQYFFTRQACSSTVKLRDRGFPFITQVQVPAVTGAVTYTCGYRPTFIKATATQTSTTVARMGIGAAIFDPSLAAEAERGQSFTVEETPAVEAVNYTNVLVQLVDATGTVQCSGNLTAWTDTGFTVDWTVVTVRPFVLFETLP